VGERRLPLGPGEDPLDERPRLVVARLADGQDRVEVDVGIDEWGRDEAALGVELTASIGGDRAGRPDLGEDVAVDPDVDERNVGACRRMDARIPDEQPRRCFLPTADSTRDEPL
jgi:hypothetical protein